MMMEDNQTFMLLNYIWDYLLSLILFFLNILFNGLY